MTKPPLGLLTAAHLLQDNRTAILRGEQSPRFRRVSAAGQHLDAAILRDGNILMIVGARGWQTHALHTLRPMRPIPFMPEIRALTGDLPARAFHKGFLLHAARILRFLGTDRPAHIIALGTGAAAAQILGTALKCPTICFAAHPVVRRRFLSTERLRRANHSQWNVLSIAWKQEVFPAALRRAGFRSLGRSTIVDFQHHTPGIETFLRHYAHLVRSDPSNLGPSLPPAWPAPDFDLPPRLP